MKREIKFRGLRKEYNKDWHQSKWYYGNLLNNCTIGEVGIGLNSYTYAEVIPETVGEYTGLKDKNGVEIYEGDIDSDHRVFTFNTSMGGWYLVRDGEGVQWHSTCLTHGGTRLPYEIIGNIHENKELINK